MPSPIDLTIWMNLPSFYQHEMFEALAATGRVNLQVIFAHPLTEDRLESGWKQPIPTYPSVMLDRHRWMSQAAQLAWSQRGRFHIVGGVWAEPAFMTSLSILRVCNTPLLIYTEYPDPAEKRSALRVFAKHSFGRWIASGRNVGLLAISHLASSYFHALGFRQTYLFGYFQKPYVGDLQSIHTKAHDEEIIFVGRLVELKRIDMLLEALFPIFAMLPNLRLVVIGDGPERDRLRTQIEQANYSERVEFLGVMPSDHVRSRISQSDLLVLPSRKDGWGMVINEALSVGVPVIVSDACGACELITSGSNGYVFHSGDVNALRECLKLFLAQTSEQREAMRAAALRTGEAISADRAAQYLVRCIDHTCGRSTLHPVPPWQEE